MRTLFVAAASIAALLTVTGQAQAQNNRSFVSGHGQDSNPCTLAAPCRTFAQAITQTNAGGEIAVLDTAGYGAINITKSVSIVNQDGVEAGITVATATDAIDINIGSSDVVNLRGLTLTGGGIGANGILFNNLGTLNIQNCVIRGFTNAGLTLVPSGRAAFNVSDTIASGGVAAVAIVPSGNDTVTATFNRVQATGGNTFGFEIDGSNSIGGFEVTIANSVVTNSDEGIKATSNTGKAITQVMVSNSVVSNNGIGVVQRGANVTAYLAKNTISGNSQGFVGDASLFSFGDNYIRGNVDDVGAIPLVATR